MSCLLIKYKGQLNCWVVSVISNRKNLSLERHILTCVEYFFQAPCYKGKCKYGGHCELVTNTTARCSCRLCHFRYKPVCGTDRRSYINHCFLRRQACLTETSILVAQRGRCCKSAFLIYLYSCYSEILVFSAGTRSNG